jgi:hypothetical protein
MRRIPDHRSGPRAAWIAEITAEIDRAQGIAWRLGRDSVDKAEANLLYGRLEAIRAELTALRFDYVEVHPEPALDWIREHLSVVDLRSNLSDSSTLDQS